MISYRSESTLKGIGFNGRYCKSLVFLIGSYLLLVTIATPSYAQKEQETFSRLGVGGQAGIPTAITAKYFLNKDLSVTAVNAWSLDRFLRVSANLSFESPIPDSPLNLFFGPGLFYGRDNSGKQTDFKSGLTLVVGVNFYVEKFEVFLQANPDFALLPKISYRVGGVVGMRYFF